MSAWAPGVRSLHTAVTQGENRQNVAALFDLTVQAATDRCIELVWPSVGHLEYVALALT